ncbi:unnamed protein product [Amoebophrya sp. A120]|nr:unnamed protein product [Amoebophrya sp. A120]|eukprot:GSA120T00008977001.1
MLLGSTSTTGPTSSNLPTLKKISDTRIPEWQGVAVFGSNGPPLNALAGEEVEFEDINSLPRKLQFVVQREEEQKNLYSFYGSTSGGGQIGGGLRGTFGAVFSAGVVGGASTTSSGGARKDAAPGRGDEKSSGAKSKSTKATGAAASDKQDSQPGGSGTTTTTTTSLVGGLFRKFFSGGGTSAHSSCTSAQQDLQHAEVGGNYGGGGSKSLVGTTSVSQDEHLGRNVAGSSVTTSCSQQLESTSKNVSKTIKRPVLAIISDRNVIAVDAKSGILLWKTNVGRRMNTIQCMQHSSCWPDKGPVLLTVGECGRICFLALKTGSILARAANLRRRRVALLKNDPSTLAETAAADAVNAEHVHPESLERYPDGSRPMFENTTTSVAHYRPGGPASSSSFPGAPILDASHDSSEQQAISTRARLGGGSSTSVTNYIVTTTDRGTNRAGSSARNRTSGVQQQGREERTSPQPQDREQEGYDDEAPPSSTPPGETETTTAGEPPPASLIGSARAFGGISSPAALVTAATANLARAAASSAEEEDHSDGDDGLMQPGAGAAGGAAAAGGTTSSTTSSGEEEFNRIANEHDGAVFAGPGRSSGDVTSATVDLQPQARNYANAATEMRTTSTSAEDLAQQEAVDQAQQVSSQEERDEELLVNQHQMLTHEDSASQGAAFLQDNVGPPGMRPGGVGYFSPTRRPVTPRSIHEGRVQQQIGLGTPASIQPNRDGTTRNRRSAGTTTGGATATAVNGQLVQSTRPTGASSSTSPSQGATQHFISNDRANALGGGDISSNAAAHNMPPSPSAAVIGIPMRRADGLDGQGAVHDPRLLAGMERAGIYGPRVRGESTWAAKAVSLNCVTSNYNNVAAAAAASTGTTFQQDNYSISGASGRGKMLLFVGGNDHLAKWVTFTSASGPLRTTRQELSRSRSVSPSAAGGTRNASSSSRTARSEEPPSSRDAAATSSGRVPPSSAAAASSTSSASSPQMSSSGTSTSVRRRNPRFAGLTVVTEQDGQQVDDASLLHDDDVPSRENSLSLMSPGGTTAGGATSGGRAFNGQNVNFVRSAMLDHTRGGGNIPCCDLTENGRFAAWTCLDGRLRVARMTGINFGNQQSCLHGATRRTAGIGRTSSRSSSPNQIQQHQMMPLRSPTSTSFGFQQNLHDDYHSPFDNDFRSLDNPHDEDLERQLSFPVQIREVGPTLGRSGDYLEMDHTSDASRPAFSPSRMAALAASASSAMQPAGAGRAGRTGSTTILRGGASAGGGTTANGTATGVEGHQNANLPSSELARHQLSSSIPSTSADEIRRTEARNHAMWLVQQAENLSLRQNSNSNSSNSNETTAGANYAVSDQLENYDEHVRDLPPMAETALEQAENHQVHQLSAVIGSTTSLVTGGSGGGGGTNNSSSAATSSAASSDTEIMQGYTRTDANFTHNQLNRAPEEQTSRHRQHSSSTTTTLDLESQSSLLDEEALHPRLLSPTTRAVQNMFLGGQSRPGDTASPIAAAIGTTGAASSNGAFNISGGLFGSPANTTHHATPPSEVVANTMSSLESSSRVLNQNNSSNSSGGLSPAGQTPTRTSTGRLRLGAGGGGGVLAAAGGSSSSSTTGGMLNLPPATGSSRSSAINVNNVATIPGAGLAPNQQQAATNQHYPYTRTNSKQIDREKGGCLLGELRASDPSSRNLHGGPLASSLRKLIDWHWYVCFVSTVDVPSTACWKPELVLGTNQVRVPAAPGPRVPGEGGGPDFISNDPTAASYRTTGSTTAVVTLLSRSKQKKQYWDIIRAFFGGSTSITGHDGVGPPAGCKNGTTTSPHHQSLSSPQHHNKIEELLESNFPSGRRIFDWARRKRLRSIAAAKSKSRYFITVDPKQELSHSEQHTSRGSSKTSTGHNGGGAPPNGPAHHQTTTSEPPSGCVSVSEKEDQTTEHSFSTDVMQHTSTVKLQKASLNSKNFAMRVVLIELEEQVLNNYSILGSAILKFFDRRSCVMNFAGVCRSWREAVEQRLQVKSIMTEVGGNSYFPARPLVPPGVFQASRNINSTRSAGGGAARTESSSSRAVALFRNLNYELEQENLLAVVTGRQFRIYALEPVRACRFEYGVDKNEILKLVLLEKQMSDRIRFALRCLVPLNTQFPLDTPGSFSALVPVVGPSSPSSPPYSFSSKLFILKPNPIYNMNTSVTGAGGPFQSNAQTARMYVLKLNRVRYTLRYECQMEEILLKKHKPVIGVCCVRGVVYCVCGDGCLVVYEVV